MKVLQLTSHLNIGGISRYLLALSENLAQRGHEVRVASDGGYLETQVGAAGLTHWHLPLRTSAEFSPQVFRSIRRLAERLKEKPVDLIHAHTRVAQVVSDQIWRRLGIPYVTTWHGIYKRRLGRRLWPCAGAMTVAISEMVRRHLIDDFRIPPERIRRIYNGIDTDYYAASPSAQAMETYRRQCGIPSDCPLIGGVGRLAEGKVKGFDLLLMAAYLLEEMLPNIQVLIVGDGPRRPFLEDVAKRLHIRDRVHFMGGTNDVRIALGLMDLFVFTSRWPEAFGLTIIEAMAAGKPVVATDVGAVPEIIRHGQDGWIVPSDDPAALAQSIAQLLGNPEMIRRLGQQAQVRVRDLFDLDRLTDEVEAVYQEVIHRV